jgi:hypothetical protein
VIASTPGLFELLAGNMEKTALFCARFGITEGMLIHGGEPTDTRDADTLDTPREPVNPSLEVRERARAALSGCLGGE